MKSDTKIPLASTGLRPKDIEAAEEVLRSGNLTMGSKVQEFETSMANYLGVSKFAMTNSGSSANLMIFESLLRPANRQPLLNAGDGVLVPAIAWPTTIWPIIQLGLSPVFVDIDPGTLAIDIQQARDLLETSGLQKIKAIFPIHPLGYAIDPEPLKTLAKEFGLIILGDVCESLGSFREDQHAGSESLAFSLSFYFSHHLTTMEGGGVATNDHMLYDDFLSIRSHGWSRNRSDKEKWAASVSSTDAQFLFVTTGYNVRPMEIQAAIGLSQLEDLSSFIERRKEIAAYVTSALNNSKLSVINPVAGEPRLAPAHSWMLLPIRVEDANREKKNKVTAWLQDAGIETRPVLTGNFLAQPSVRRIFGYLPHPEAFPNASDISESSFLVGCHHDFTDNQVEFLVDTLRSVSA